MSLERVFSFDQSLLVCPSVLLGLLHFLGSVLPTKHLFGPSGQDELFDLPSMGRRVAYSGQRHSYQAGPCHQAFRERYVKHIHSCCPASGSMYEGGPYRRR
jgi:hypothetical protein